MKPKTFGNVKLAELRLDSGDTSVGILMAADSTAFRCSEAAHFGETVSFAGDVDTSSGELKAKDVDIIAGGGLTIAAGIVVPVFSAVSITHTETTAYADNAAAVSGGLASGDIYHTATGEMRIVV